MKKKLVSAISLLSGMAAGAVVVNQFVKEKIKKEAKNTEKFYDYYQVLEQWLALKQNGLSLEKYFQEQGYKTIAIYGMGGLGNRLYDDLKDSSVTVAYGIDQDADNICSDLKIVTKEDSLEEVDVIVVTAMFAFDAIYEELVQKVDCDIVSLDAVVYEVY